MHDSLKLFGEVCNSDWFRDATMILLLNKQDVFKEMITRINLNVCFDDYDGPGGYEDGVKFISKKFLAVNRNPRKNIFVFIVNATDTESISTIFQSVKDVILRCSLLATL